MRSGGEEKEKAAKSYQTLGLSVSVVEIQDFSYLLLSHRIPEFTRWEIKDPVVLRGCLVLWHRVGYYSSIIIMYLLLNNYLTVFILTVAVFVTHL